MPDLPNAYIHVTPDRQPFPGSMVVVMLGPTLITTTIVNPGRDLHTTVTAALATMGWQIATLSDTAVVDEDGRLWFTAEEAPDG